MDPFFKICWGHFRDHFGTRSAQEGAKMSPKRSIRSFNDPNTVFAKTLKNHWFFKVFGLQRPPKRALGNPRSLPRGTERAPKLNKNGV